VWLLLYARFMDQVVRFDRCALFVIYAKSLAASVAALMPLGLVYGLWLGPDAVGAGVLGVATGLGGLLWLGCLWATRHPAFADITGLVQHVMARPRRRPTGHLSALAIVPSSIPAQRVEEFGRTWRDRPKPALTMRSKRLPQATGPRSNWSIGAPV
jgi:hypothetical protein